LAEEGESTTAAVLDWSRGRGADAVLLCAAGSGSEIANLAPARCRDRAIVVVVGDVRLELSRRPYYEKELSLRFARSYGPGRYERGYEEHGVDYPVGQIRWSEGRNFEAVLDLVASRRLRVSDLVTHRFDIADAASAYQLIEARSEPYLAVQLCYLQTPAAHGPILLREPAAHGGAGIGWLGAGGFSTATLLPAFQEAGFDRFVAVASAQGLSARRVAERFGFEKAVSEAEEVIDDPDVGTVVIATTHDRHAELVVRALEAGKHVWCEKPPALTLDELDSVVEAHRGSPGVLFVGYNRRWAPALRAIGRHLPSNGTPATVVYRIAAGSLPDKHWYHDRRQGGRLRGEVCHFVDACCALVGSGPEAVAAVAGGAGELGLAEDVGLVVRHVNGSVSTVTYCAASPAGVGKERVEVFAGSHYAIIDDYRRVVVDGRRRWSGRQDKGHRAAVRAFRDALRCEPPRDLTADMLASTRATLAALASAAGGPSVSNGRITETH
jgi:predicted dehydrogenase